MYVVSDAVLSSPTPAGASLKTGAAVGSGRQTMVAYINICSYYFIGVPVGVLLGYVGNLKIKGIWIGMIVGVVIQSLALGYITSTTDWNEQVNKASERLNIFKRPLEESNGDYNIVNE
ncbi:protein DETOXIFICATION 38-like [Pistacia vera]|uniref:protein DETOXIFICATION 38-like n=1 Tax=Pistacia vera TaxID=55513 RepID=UPI00126364F9|nr:protein DETOXIFICATION 38-like [Pistacia vera]